jgi:response regulator RpfG family c-di-GMP phosphodiesterase
MKLNTQQAWKILVVDDEAGLHDVTRLVLRRMQYAGHPVELISAYSAHEAEEIIKVTPNIAVAIVDVVMENDQAGLDLVKIIRNQYGMNKVRIILRTGNPGMAPQREVIQHFEIDDYRDKTELTADRLFTAVYTALRSFNTLKIIDETSHGLEQIIRSTDTLLQDENNNSALLIALLTNLQEVNAIASSPLQFSDVMGIYYASDKPTIFMATGAYADLTGHSLDHIIDDDLKQLLNSHFSSKAIYIGERGVLLAITLPNQQYLALWIASEDMLQAHVTYLIQILLERFNSNLVHNHLQNEILNAQRTALGKLCEAVEMRSKETGQHIHRMAAYSKLLAQLHGLPAEQVNLIEAAAPLHDIGKVAIPDSVLNKAGPLTPDEMEIMRTHAQNGYELLAQSNSKMLQTGAEVALTHHERWDGTGYPNGLKGTQIPLFGRIVNIADVFDALMSRRVYKEAFPLDKTIQIMSDLSEKAFDPELLDLLVKNKDQFGAIFVQNPDQND